MKSATLTTDGSCIPNPGPGSWAFVLREGDSVTEQTGKIHENTTNNRMEFEAIIQGLLAVKEPSWVHIRTDSKIALSWIRPGTWDSHKQRAKLPHQYAQWLRFMEASRKHKITSEWVRGHNGDPDNERCDLMANTRVLVSPELYLATA